MTLPTSVNQFSPKHSINYDNYYNLDLSSNIYFEQTHLKTEKLLSTMLIMTIPLDTAGTMCSKNYYNRTLQQSSLVLKYHADAGLATAVKTFRDYHEERAILFFRRECRKANSDTVVS